MKGPRMAIDPNNKTSHSGKPSTGGGKREVNAGTHFSKRGNELPKPPTTSVANHTQSQKAQKGN